MDEEGLIQKIEELMQTVGLDCSACTDRCSAGCRGDPETGYAPLFPLDEVSEAKIREVRPELIDEYLGVPVIRSDEEKGCYAFNNEIGDCSIHKIKPLYCRLYPLMVVPFSTISVYGGPGYFAGLTTKLQQCENMIDINNLEKEERREIERKGAEIVKEYPIFSARMETLFRENQELFEKYKIR